MAICGFCICVCRQWFKQWTQTWTHATTECVCVWKCSTNVQKKACWQTFWWLKKLLCLLCLVGLFEQVNSRKQSVQPHSNNWAIDVEHSNITTQRIQSVWNEHPIYSFTCALRLSMTVCRRANATNHLNWQFNVTWKPVFFSTFIHTLISKGSAYMDDLPTLLIIVLRVACYLAVIVQPTSVCPLYK